VSTRGLAARAGYLAEPVRAAIESMNGARFVHDQLELAGWDVEIADAVKVKGLAPLACKTDRIDAWVLAELARRDLVPAIWLPDPQVRAERERARFRLHLVRHRTSLKLRVHAVLLAHGKPCHVSDLFGAAGRALLERLALPQPWADTVDASLQLIDELDLRLTRPTRQKRSPLPALGTNRSVSARLQTSRLPRPLPTHQAASRQTTPRQGRPDRPRPPAHRSNLAHAHPQPTLRSGSAANPLAA
jgi:hypothetical protein